MKILVTAGGTEEPIDGVRRLTNTSSGATGAVLARHFSERGAEVLLLHAQRALVTNVGCRRECFVSFSDLEGALHRNLSEEAWDVVVHLAAVGDYSIASVEVDGVPFITGGRGKIGTGHEVTLRLAANPKIIDKLHGWSLNPDIIIVGFKLTDEADPTLREKAVQHLMDRARPEFVVHNDLCEIGPEHHKATFFDRTGLIARSETKDEMARTLWHLISKGVIQ
jgi:phosphopantothenoylcysteine decarboxylase/phosphopantothenate--cysteine ligase